MIESTAGALSFQTPALRYGDDEASPERGGCRRQVQLGFGSRKARVTAANSGKPKRL
jgi:hypothetical protein